MRSVFIINPRAGKRSTVRKLTASIEMTFMQRGGDFSIFITKGRYDARNVAHDEAMKGDKVQIFACGGDGTMFEVLNGVAGFENVTLGVIPCGTGNDFLKYFGADYDFSDIPSQLDGTVINIDAIKCGNYYSLNEASMGFDAQVCQNKDKFSRLPGIGGQLAYVLSLFYCFIFSLKNRLTVQIDGGEPVTRDYLFAVAANGRYCGGGFKNAPDAEIADGKLDFLTVDTVSRFKVATLMKRYSNGTHGTLPMCHFSVGQEMTVSAEKPTAVNLDGEVIVTDKITFKVVPGFVKFILPGVCGSHSDLKRLRENQKLAAAVCADSSCFEKQIK